MRITGRFDLVDRIEATDMGPRRIQEWLEPTGLFKANGDQICRHVRTESLPPQAFEQNDRMRNASHNGDVIALKGAKMQMSMQAPMSAIPNFWERLKDGPEAFAKIMNDGDYRKLRTSKGHV